MDKVSKILVETLITSSMVHPGKDSRHGTQMYHVVNPSTTTWALLAPKILSFYPKAFDMGTVPFEKWIELLTQSANESMDPKRNPAVTLLDFYRNAAKVGKEGQRARMLESQKAKSASRTLQRVGAVDEGWVKSWMQQWGILDD